MSRHRISNLLPNDRESLIAGHVPAHGNSGRDYSHVNPLIIHGLSRKLYALITRMDGA